MIGFGPLGSTPLGAIPNHFGTAAANLEAASPGAPEFIIPAILELGEHTSEGDVVVAVAAPWFAILERIARDPSAAYEIDARAWEEIIAGSYERTGIFDHVVLTPRSGDLGRDVIATKSGAFSIRIFDQVKAYAPGHVVTANDVRAMLGVITGAQNVSKGVITTTSTFAPRIEDDPFLRSSIPYRLELRGRDTLLAWLKELSAKRP
jgi:restriction system protein